MLMHASETYPADNKFTWAHARHFFTPAKMVAGYRVKSSPLQATDQFNPSQPAEILSMKKHWLSNKRYGRNHESTIQQKTANEKRKFYS